MDWLKKLLEKYGVSEETSAKMLADTEAEKYVPKHRLDEVTSAKNELQTQIAQRDADLSE